MTLTKAHIIDSVYNSTDLNRPQATRAVETFLESIKTALAGEGRAIYCGLLSSA